MANQGLTIATHIAKVVCSLSAIWNMDTTYNMIMMNTLMSILWRRVGICLYMRYFDLLTG